MKLLLTILCLAVTFNVYAQIDTVSLNSLGLKGGIESIVEISFSVRDSLGIPIKNKVIDEGRFKIDKSYAKTNYVCLFDEKHRQYMHTDLYTNLEKKQEVIYLYDGDLIAGRNEDLYFSDAHITLQTKYLYNKLNQIISSISYRNGLLFQKNMYKYDQNGHMTDSYEIDSNGSIDEHTTYKYNPKGLLLSKKRQSNPPDKLLDDEYMYQYDSLSREIMGKITWDGGSAKSQYFYNANSLDLLKRIIYKNGEEGEIGTVENYIYSNGRLQQRVFMDGNGVINNTFDITYENDGSVCEVSHKDKTETLKNKYGDVVVETFNKGEITMEEYIYEYTYDDHGNWTKIIEYKNTIPLLMKLRMIKYH